MMRDEFGDQIVLVDHHIQDALENPWTQARKAFYGVGGIPHVVFDGGHPQIGAGGCSGTAAIYRSRIEARLAEVNSLSPVSIVGEFGTEAMTITLAARFTLVESEPLPEDTRAYLLVLEDDVSGSYDHITRAGYDEAVLLASLGDEVLVTADFPIDPSWNQQNLFGVAFLQSSGAELEVIQAAHLPEVSTDVPELAGGAESVWSLRMSPNPVAVDARGIGSATVRMALPGGADMGSLRLDLIDFQGRIVRQLYHDRPASDALTLSFDGRGTNGQPLASGSYWLRATSAAGTRETRVVVLR